MKIVACEPIAVPSSPPHAGGHVLTLVRILTDDGTVGWGEVCAQHIYYTDPRPFGALVRAIADRLIIGRDVWERNTLVSEIFTHFGCGRTDFMVSCVASGFEIALWDIIGKIVDRPIVDLLGGARRNRLRTYTYIYSDDPNEGYAQTWLDRKSLQSNACRLVDRGFTALKFDPLPMPFGRPASPPPWPLSTEALREGADLLSAVREVIGDDIDLIVGTHGQLTLSAALEFGRMLGDIGVLWFEEPVGPETDATLRTVVSGIDVDVASGERAASATELYERSRASGLRIVQPDVCSIGGISETVRAATRVAELSAVVAPHLWGGPIALAATGQVAAALPNFLIQECIGEPPVEHREIFDSATRLVDGQLLPSTSPGLGIRVDEERLSKVQMPC